MASAGASAQAQQPQPAPAPSATSGQRPNILVIFGDDIGQTNISAYSFGLMGYRTPNIDQVAREGMMSTDYYAEQNCAAGRSAEGGIGLFTVAFPLGAHAPPEPAPPVVAKY
jgi:arylsulfatase